VVTKAGLTVIIDIDMTCTVETYF